MAPSQQLIALRPSNYVCACCLDESDTKTSPELNTTQKWWAAFMGDRAFARARAAGKNETVAGHARAKAEADIALSLPAEYTSIL